MIDKKWIKSLGLAMGLPSTILFSAVFCKSLVDKGILSWTYSSLIFIAIIGNTIFLMVYYSYKNKKK